MVNQIFQPVGPRRFAMAALMLCLVGCGRPASLIPTGSDVQIPKEDLNFYPYDRLPKPRLGALPFNGPATLFAAADPDNLGEHHYRSATGEKERGILYTCKAGFIDIAHVRKSADLVPYCQVRLEAALKHKLTDLRFRSREPSVYHVTINYPAWWDTMSESDRATVQRELSIRLAQHLAFYMVSWHEVLTWYGYKSWGIISEKQSAFCYDDNPSHMLGVLSAGDALRNNTLEYDPAMTAAISGWLDVLDVATIPQMYEAIKAVHGKWWSGSVPLRRHLDVALDDGSLRPWIVPGLECGPNAQPFTFQLPDLHQINGRSLGDIWRVQIDPNVIESAKVRRIAGTEDDLIDYYRDMPRLIADVRKELVKKHGEDAVNP